MPPKGGSPVTVTMVAGFRVAAAAAGDMRGASKSFGPAVIRYPCRPSYARARDPFSPKGPEHCGTEREAAVGAAQAGGGFDCAPRGPENPLAWSAPHRAPRPAPAPDSLATATSRGDLPMFLPPFSSGPSPIRRM